MISRMDMPIEMKVVAYMARGDTYEVIRQAIFDEFGQRPSKGVLSAIKKRNQTSLSVIKEAVLEREKNDATNILNKTNRLMQRKLGSHERAMQQYEEYEEQFRLGNLTASDFKFLSEQLDIPNLNVLTSVSKEMYHQAKGDPADDAALATTSPQEKLKELQAVLEENDEIRLERIVFAKREPDAAVPAQVISTIGDNRDETGGIPQQHGVPG